MSQLVRLEGKHTAQTAHCALMKMGGNRQNYFELCSIQARVQLLREVFPPTSPFNLSAIKHFVKESVFGCKGGGTFQHKTYAI